MSSFSHCNAADDPCPGCAVTVRVRFVPIISGFRGLSDRFATPQSALLILQMVFAVDYADTPRLGNAVDFALAGVRRH